MRENRKGNRPTTATHTHEHSANKKMTLFKLMLDLDFNEQRHSFRYAE